MVKSNDFPGQHILPPPGQLQIYIIKYMPEISRYLPGD